MKTELVLFGHRYNMATRERRRRLVLLFYGVFAALLLAIWLGGSRTGGGLMTIEFTILVGPILGGYFYSSFNIFGSTGIVEPFAGNAMIARRIKSGGAPPQGVESLEELHNDERALGRRDYSHYVSHRFLGTVVCVAFLVEYLKNSTLQRFFGMVGMSAARMDSIVYLLLQVAYISFFTLPQAILLWTEPDMEEAQ